MATGKLTVPAAVAAVTTSTAIELGPRGGTINDNDNGGNALQQRTARPLPPPPTPPRPSTPSSKPPASPTAPSPTAASRRGPSSRPAPSCPSGSRASATRGGHAVRARRLGARLGVDALVGRLRAADAHRRLRGAQRAPRPRRGPARRRPRGHPHHRRRRGRQRVLRRQRPRPVRRRGRDARPRHEPLLHHLRRHARAVLPPEARAGQRRRLRGRGLGGAAVTVLQGVLIQRFGVAWTYRIVGLAALVTGLPAALVIKERHVATAGASPPPAAASAGKIEWRLFRDARFLLIFLAGAVATFPLLVPAFFLPLYAHSLGLSASAGAGLLAGFNFSSALGRVLCGLMSDRLGPLNTLLATLVASGAGMLVLWPASTTLGPLALFAGAPIAGYLLDAYGGQDNGLQAYRPAMFYAGSLALGAAVLVVVMRLRMNPSLKARV
ncbi:hypothetical protein ACCO45_007371 [Purpureocillium lilacinum]|uniref:Uncharacterized protein n=1 Tax=Purpureocillium lilacinum TaxID=33203 RepID=A0ACC4DS90_PURLI